MKINFFNSILLIICLNSIQSYGQISKPEFIPPAPSSYALAKYGDIPVSLYSGLPDISVPVCTVKEGGLTVDVSLSYHGSGIKVDEVASWVGLGWSLDAGGVIVRKVRGRAEYLSSTGELLPERADIGFFSLSQGISRAEFIQQNNLQAAANNSLDTEPDEFTFNFNGRTGSFFFDGNGNVKLNKEEDIRIELQYATGFEYNIVITTEDGVAYEFEDYEKTYFTGVNQMHITAWYLTKIKSPTGSEILFENQSTGTVNHDIRQYSEYVAELTANPSIYPAVTPVTGVSVSEMRLKKIITSSGWVEFMPGTQQRLDYKTSSYPLEYIAVYNSDGSLHRGMNLYSSYFESNNGNKYNGADPSVYQHLNYRLRLDSLQQLSSSGTAVGQPYKFDYWGDDNPSTNDLYTLPYRLSPKQDHWGYFNNSTNQHIFPGNSEGRSIGSDRWYIEFAEYSDIYVNNSIGNGANRQPDAEAVKANSLKAVHYPTGGQREFLFESNVFSGMGGIGGGLRIGKIIDHFGNNETKETGYIYDQRWQALDPRRYYKYFTIGYRNNGQPFLSTDLLSFFGLPTGNNPEGEQGFIKISAFPQAILGGGTQSGYGSVKVVQTGNGYTINEFDTNITFPDYNGPDDIYDDIDMSQMDGLFNSGYITSMQPPVGGSDFQKGTTVLDVPYPVLYDNSWKRGNLKARSTFSESGVLLKREKFEYTRQLLSVTPGYKVFGWNTGQEFLYSRYYLPNASIKMKKRTVEDYNTAGMDPYVTSISYSYDNPLHSQPTGTVVLRSDGSKEVTISSYPLDYPSGTAFIDDLKDGNLLDNPIETVRYRESGAVRTVLSGEIKKFKTGGQGLIDQIHRLETQDPIAQNSFKFSNRSIGVLPPTGAASGFLPDERYNVRVLGELYDGKGNLRQWKNPEGSSVSYIWSYNFQHPIAEASNATFDEISFTSFETTGKGGWTYTGSLNTSTYKTGMKAYNLGSGSVTKTGIGASASTPYKVGFWARRTSGTGNVNVGGQTEALTTSWKWVEKTITSTSLTISGSSVVIDELRLHPADAMMTSYTYEPLVGMTSQTDPRGYTLIYEYDTANRLKTIKDEEGKILEHYEYNYATGN